MSDDIVICDGCDGTINCEFDVFHVVFKGDDKEIHLCQFCFDEIEDELKEDGWECDDWEE